jgi:RNA polymerase sigma-70 factor (ECF subfamily)
LDDAVKKNVLDAAALDSLSRRRGAALRRYFERRRIVGADAEDAVQDVFARLSTRIGITDTSRIDGYLFEVASSVAVDFARKSKSRFAGQHDEYQESVHFRPTVSPEQVYLDKEDVTVLVMALRELPERTRNALLLARLEGLKYAEIGARLGLSVSSVEKLIVKASTHIARRMKGRSR